MFKALFCLVMMLGLMMTGYASSEFEEGGDNTLRIENEYKLSVPQEKTEAVWTYLTERYGNDHSFLKDIDAGFKATLSEENFVDTYYDTQEYDLLSKQSGIRHRRRYMPNDPDNKKNGRELIQIKLNHLDDNELNRGEYKFKVKHYDKAKGLDDAYPLVKLVRREDRDAFKERLKELGYNPYQFTEVLTLNQRRRRVYITLNDEAFATITLDEVSSKKWWQKADFTEIEMELNEVGYTEADETYREKMETINASLKDDLLQTFPDIRQDQTPKYNKTYNVFSKKLLCFKQALALNTPIEAILGLVFLLVLMGLFLGMRKP